MTGTLFVRRVELSSDVALTSSRHQFANEVGAMSDKSSTDKNPWNNYCCYGIPSRKPIYVLTIKHIVYGMAVKQVHFTRLK